MKPFLVAIDPGSAGGIAWFEEKAGVQARKMPDSVKGVVELVRFIYGRALVSDGMLTVKNDEVQTGEIRVGVELVGGFVKPPKVVASPGSGKCPTCGKPEVEEIVGQPGSAMFTFGKSTGIVHGAFLALGATVEEIRPQTWQAGTVFGAGKASKMSKTVWKNILKTAAQSRFPSVKVTLGTADALLILAYMAQRDGRADILARVEPPRPVARVSVGKPPAGYSITKDRTTVSGDLVWNADKKAWEPCDSRNAYVADYHAVCRKDPEPGQYLTDWKGSEWVTNGKVMFRRATDYDMATLKRRADGMLL